MKEAAAPPLDTQASCVFELRNKRPQEEYLLLKNQYKLVVNYKILCTKIYKMYVPSKTCIFGMCHGFAIILN